MVGRLVSFWDGLFSIFRRTSLPQWAVKQPHRFHWKQWMLDAFVCGLRGERENCVNKMVSHPKSYKIYKRSKHRLTNKNCIQQTYLTLNAWRKTVPQRKFSQRNIYQTIWGGIIALDRTTQIAMGVAPESWIMIRWNMFSFYDYHFYVYHGSFPSFDHIKKKKSSILEGVWVQYVNKCVRRHAA